MTSERTIAKPLTPEKTRTMNDENRRTYGHCSQIYVIRGLLSDYFWQIYFIFFSCQEHFISEMPEASVLKRGQIRG